MSTKNIDSTQPFANWEELDVTFGPVANADTVIAHTLAPIDPEAVNYLPVRKSKSCDIYHDVSASRKKWAQTYIVLRSTVANAQVKLLLYVSAS